MEAVPLFVRKIFQILSCVCPVWVYTCNSKMDREKGSTMEIHVYKYGMRLRPYDIGCQPKEGFVGVEDGGTADGRTYHNFVYYIAKLDSETAADYDLDYLGVKFLKAEEM